MENGQNTEVLSQLRELYMQNYKVRLKISRREKALVAESIGYINEQDFLRGYYAYMLDGGEGAEREKHPLAWYLEQVSQWVAKAIDKDWMEDAEGRWNPKWVRQVRHYLGMPFNHICGECGVQGGRHLPSCVNAEKVAAI